MSNSIIVIPCYNEAARLNVEAFEAFAAAHPDIRFLFVDDGSVDNTRAVLESMQQRNPQRFGVLGLPRNMGKAEAVRHGLLEAAASRPDYIGFWDADLATPLETIPEFVRLLDAKPDIQMVFGSRVNLLGRSVRRKLMRHYIGRIFATAAAATIGLGIYDTQCGAKLFRVTDGLLQRLRDPFISRWIFDVEIIAREIQARRGTDLPQARQIIYEHPLMVWHDVAGSKIKFSDFFIVAIDLVRIYFRYIHRQRPAEQPAADASEPATAVRRG